MLGVEKMSKRKEFLYRYYAKEDYILDVLKNKRLYHCLPSEFNDPFDCRPLISIKHSRCDNNTTWHKLLYYFAKMYAKMHDPDTPQIELMKQANAAFAKGLHRNQTWLSEIDESLKTVGSLVRVCCFAKSPRNMMMWAHYSNNHRGLAFQFRRSFLHDAASGEFRGQEVVYTPGALGVQDYVDCLERGLDHGDILAMARIIYSTKTIHWEREEEVRFFSEKSRPYLSFSESALCGIVFGSQCEENLIRHVLDALAGWQLRPRLFKASIEKSTHKLWIGKL